MKNTLVLAPVALALALAACGSAEDTASKAGAVAAAATGELDDDQLSMADVDYAVDSQLALGKAGYTDDLEDEDAPASADQSPEQYAAAVAANPAMAAVFAKADVDPARFHRAISMVAAAALGGEMAASMGKTDKLPQPAQFYLDNRAAIQKRLKEAEAMMR